MSLSQQFYQQLNKGIHIFGDKNVKIFGVRDAIEKF